MSELGIFPRAPLAEHLCARTKPSGEAVIDTPAKDFETLFSVLPDWRSLTNGIEARLSAHGDYPRWRAVLERLPRIEPSSVSFGSTVKAEGELDDGTREALTHALQAFHPWRKGPFELFGIHIDSEWRSDWKWQRLAPFLTPSGDFEDASILDVGCGNGYFGWRMLEAGARCVVGVDPTVVFYMQHQALSRYLNTGNGRKNWLIPLAFEALPGASFDAVFSMGVIYHRNDPAEHIKRLAEFTRPGGRLVLESIVVADPAGLQPEGRYARMRNISRIPSIEQLQSWMAAAGFQEIRVVDISPTTTAEQRQTAWMTFESLAQALEPGDPTKTVEGHPAPQRATLIARREAAA